MKRILRFILKALFYISYIFFIAFGITLLILILGKNQEYSSLNTQITQLTEDSSLKNSKINDLESQNITLKAENESMKLESLKQDGLGKISGKISGQVLISDGQITQYQFVCAQNKKNANFQYCLNVSSLTQDFSLLLPEGTYRVYAKAVNNLNAITLSDYEGLYTEYVKCLNEKPQNECDQTKLDKEQTVEIKTGKQLDKINPVDWRKITN